MTKIPLRKESIIYILSLAIITLIFYSLNHFLVIILFLFLLFAVYFFRDPKRAITLDEKALLSPADGTVMSISQVTDVDLKGSNAIKINIFLWIFNVHIIRSPITGVVVFKGYRFGTYLPAFISHASELNERNTIHVENQFTKVIHHQITGLIARIIVCFSNVGDSLKQGERFGLIKFGSCTEIIVQDNIVVKVKKSDTVRGGITVIGVVK